MKKVALSLLVAFGLSLPAVTAAWAQQKPAPAPPAQTGEVRGWQGQHYGD